MRTSIDRRTFLKAVGSTAALAPLAALGGCGIPRARVVVIGGGFGGATAARYLRMWDPGIQVTLVERGRTFRSCPMSNLVLTGHRQSHQLEHGYEALERLGVTLVHDDAMAVYPESGSGQGLVRLAGGGDLEYDRLIVSPGIDFVFDDIVGCEAAIEAGQVFHAWRPGPQTVGLRDQLEAMEDGGVYVLTIPPMPYRCPPGPYERASLVADYFQRAKPRSRVLVFDANPDLVSKGELFRTTWEERYSDILEYIPDTGPGRIDGSSLTVDIDGEAVQADVLNVIPPQRAGEIASRAGLLTENGRWCGVDWRTCESLAVPNIHVLGDATASAPGMPKSGHMANAQAKVCASAVVALLNGRSPDPEPILTNTCYSFVSGLEAMHVASVHRWDRERTTVTPVPEAAGLSVAPSEDEAIHAWSWARNIWGDSVG